MDKNGLFDTAEMTSCGLNGKPLGLGRYEAGIACNLFAQQGAEKSVFFKNKNKTDLHPCILQDGEDRENDPWQYIHNLRDGSVAGFKYFECDCSSLVLTVRGSAGRIEVFSDLQKEPVGSVAVNESTQLSEYALPFTCQNKTAIYLKFRGSGSMDLYALELK